MAMAKMEVEGRNAASEAKSPEPDRYNLSSSNLQNAIKPLCKHLIKIQTSAFYF